jgi:hypothetical protein
LLESLCGLGAAVAAFVTVNVSAASQPSVQWKVITGHTLGIAGSGWPANGTIIFTMNQGDKLHGIVLTATDEGPFEIGIKDYSCRQGSTSRVRDLNGASASLPVLDPCGPQHATTAPTFIVAQGSASQSARYLTGLGHETVVHIGRGGVISFWERGTSHASVIPSAPSRFFVLIGHSRGNAPNCRSNCTPGFY